MRVVGIDPGSVSWDFYGYEKKRNARISFLDGSIPSEKVKKNPIEIIKILKQNLPIDAIAAPSGFGLPLREFSRNNPLTPKELELITLRKTDETEIMGLRKVVNLISDLPARLFILPSVKHFQTIPRHRKINIIDMGTADKVCNVFLGIQQQLAKEKISSLSSVNFILCEVGRGFSAVIAVEKGQIIDGIGGTNILGYNSIGKMDGELVYLSKSHLTSKSSIYQGGIKDILPNIQHNISQSPNTSENWSDIISGHLDDSLLGKLLIEQILKAFLQLMGSFTSISFPIPVLLTGSGISLQKLKKQLEKHGDKFPSPLFQVEILHPSASVAKTAAQGAAFIAEGILGGEFNKTLEHMGLFSTNGTVLDDLFFPHTQI